VLLVPITVTPTSAWLIDKYNFYFARLYYDDSTISLWYGFGFVLFLFRALLSAVGFVFDLIIMLLLIPVDLTLFLGNVIHNLINETARNLFLAVVAIGVTCPISYLLFKKFSQAAVLTWERKDWIIVLIYFYPITIILLSIYLVFGKYIPIKIRDRFMLR